MAAPVNPNKMLLACIMKNEAANLPDMLASVEPHIIGAAITDTGSTDNSIQIVESFFKERGKPVWISHAPFENFSQARNANLRAARAVTEVDWEWLLLCDCDMRLRVEHAWPKLDHKAYALCQSNGIVKYFNVRILKRDEPVEYVGATHECLTPEEPPVAIQGGIYYDDKETGANRIDKYTRDIQLLKEELLEDPLNPRSTFYMIQSLMGAGLIESARAMCDFRIAMDGHPEEKFWTLLQMAHFDATLGKDAALIEHEFLQAYSFRPIRAEPLHHLSRHHAARGEHAVALLYATVAAAMPAPYEILPIELAVYEWWALDNMLTVAVACGNKVQAQWAARKLKKRKIPDAEQARIEGNIKKVLK